MTQDSHKTHNSTPKSIAIDTVNTARLDRSFDEIADHFEKKVYGGLKGEIRLAVLRRDIFKFVAKKSQALERPLRILDVGAGLAQIATELALQGHDVTINDVSPNMIAKAQARFEAVKNDDSDVYADVGVDSKNIGQVTWEVCAYQALNDTLGAQTFDLILCHALLEWLAEPQSVMGFFDQHLCETGAISLCFYNPASFDYRNLIMGNFNVLNNKNYQADNKKSLTPNHPVTIDEVTDWLDIHRYTPVTTSGLRVFHDYVMTKRGGNTNTDAVIEMELRYSVRAPYKWLGRYIHILARRD